MRFLVDECTGPKVAAWLRGQGHEVFSVFDEARGIQDDQVIQKAYNENWILITNDKDLERKYIESGMHIESSFLCDLKMSVLAIRFKSFGGCLKVTATGLKINS